MLSIPNLFKNTTQKSQATVISKFKTLFFEKMKKSIDSEFLILTSICITNCKQKSVNTEEPSDFLLEILTKKGKKSNKRKNNYN